MQGVFRESKTEGFQHEAVLYEGLDDLASTTVPFIREGLELQEPVLVAVLPDRIRTLRSALGSDAERVQFLDIAEFGGNPGRIIPMWRAFVDRSTGSGSVRGIGEPVWSSRRDVEIEECHLHESLLNVAFDEGPPWRLMCP
ncbi:MAG TPA: MEDS domain-containing protein, partial [Gemmatimonadales bacterium]|nr:MEDS domain-containing protein [Gemmatimonadales bacterium]